MYNEYKDQGLVVLGISLDQEKDALPKFIKDYNITYPILYGNQQIARAYEVQSIPTLVIFDKKGKIAFREVGFSDENITTLEQKIKDALAQ
jgi:peroxiredoxin